jgi:hypothetical protein
MFSSVCQQFAYAPFPVPIQNFVLASLTKNKEFL